MADTKKPSVKKPAATKSPEERLVELRKDLLELQKSHAAGELVNPRALRSNRKEIARLLTKLNTKSKETE